MSDDSRTASPGPVWRWSYLAIPVSLFLAAYLGLSGMVLAILFSFFALSEFRRLTGGRTWAAITLFIVAAALLSYATGYFLRQAARELPDIIDSSVPAIADWAEQHGLTVPFTDYESLKELVMTTARSEAGYIGEAARLARGAAEHMILLAVGIFISMALFAHLFSHHPADKRKLLPANLNELASVSLGRRFAMFYESFALIMGAQITIAAINSVLVAIFVVATQLPHAVVVIGLTFLCDMLPVVGNLISNAVMLCIAFTVSPRDALIALIFLVVVHKLEYFLNSRIIGQRIHLPIWLILLALIVGEKMMGVTGMILSPVVLHYIRAEAAAIPVASPD